MDIEKLIERLRTESLYADKASLEIMDLCMEAATALSTLQDENAQLRETVDKYATAARVIALHLKPFCDESLPYDEMIADAARKASDELEQVKAERDAAISDLETIMAYGGGNLDTCQYCKNGQCYARGGTKLCLPKWRSIKED